jgi:hypothetical protein
VQTSDTSFHLVVSPGGFALGITGGVYYRNDTFRATVGFTTGSSMAGANVSLSISGGLPNGYNQDWAFVQSPYIRSLSAYRMVTAGTLR